MMDRFCPKRREAGLRIETFQGELLAYDLDRNEAHCLSGPAVTVWEMADGTVTVDQIAARLAETVGGAPDVDLVWRTLAEIDAAHLLDRPLAEAGVDQSRRQALLKVAWAAAVPLVLSIVVPEPSFAQSVGPTGPTGQPGPTGPIGDSNFLPVE
jgi:hypothetical protein